MAIGNICQRDVDTFEAHELVTSIASRMHQRGVGALVGVDGARHPIGIVTDRDLMVRVLAGGKDAATTTASAVMTPSPRTIYENSPIETAIQLMRGGAFRRLPVVDSHGVLVGLVTLDDILMLLADEFGDVGRMLEKQTPAAALSGCD